MTIVWSGSTDLLDFEFFLFLVVSIIVVCASCPDFNLFLYFELIYPFVSLRIYILVLSFSTMHVHSYFVSFMWFAVEWNWLVWHGISLLVFQYTYILVFSYSGGFC